MKVIKLSDLYEVNKDIEIIISDEVWKVFDMFNHEEDAYKARVKYHRAFYSLDRDQGIWNDVLKKVPTPEELLIKNEIHLELFNALHQLSDKQASRIYCYFILGMSMTEIARKEKVNISSVSESIHKGIRNLNKLLPNPYI